MGGKNTDEGGYRERPKKKHGEARRKFNDREELVGWRVLGSYVTCLRNWSRSHDVLHFVFPSSVSYEPARSLSIFETNSLIVRSTIGSLASSFDRYEGRDRHFS